MKLRSITFNLSTPDVDHYSLVNKFSFLNWRFFSCEPLIVLFFLLYLFFQFSPLSANLKCIWIHVCRQLLHLTNFNSEEIEFNASNGKCSKHVYINILLCLAWISAHSIWCSSMYGKAVISNLYKKAALFTVDLYNYLWIPRTTIHHLCGHQHTCLIISASADLFTLFLFSQLSRLDCKQKCDWDGTRHGLEC